MEGFDLEERTAVFGEAVIALSKQIKRDDVNSVLVRQLVRAGTSVGANYSEANNAESRPDFKHKIGICRKESCEAKHWLRMLGSANPDKVEQARKLWQEAHQLNLIFSKIRRGIKLWRVFRHSSLFRYSRFRYSLFGNPCTPPSSISPSSTSLSTVTA